MPKIALNLLDPDPRNANVCDETTLAKIERNIQRTGFCPQLIIRPHPTQKGRYMILDGHHRKQVLEKLGWNKVDCQIWTVDETETQLALSTLNRLRGTDNLNKRASLIESLTQLLPMPDLTDLIPETSTEIEDLLRLARFDFEEVEKALNERAQAEKDALPVALSFLLPPEGAGIVEKALKRYLKGDRGEALIAVCREVLSHAT